MTELETCVIGVSELGDVRRDDDYEEKSWHPAGTRERVEALLGQPVVPPEAFRRSWLGPRLDLDLNAGKVAANLARSGDVEIDAGTVDG